MVFGEVANWAVSCLLLSLRVAPVIALAPPFNLVALPPLFRALLGLALSVCLVSLRPQLSWMDAGAGPLAEAALRELMLGGIFVVAFQLVFGAIYLAGRTIDIQAGYGLAMLVDPATQNNVPLIGTLFAYAFGAVFFAMNGHGEVMRILSASLDAIPIGHGVAPNSLVRLLAFISAVFTVSLGMAGGAILCLFLADVTIALLARTAPQINALVLGFQIKTLLLLLILPVVFGFASAQMIRLARITLESLPGLLG